MQRWLLSLVAVVGLGGALFYLGGSVRGQIGAEAQQLGGSLGSGMTYQGRLELDGEPANGNYDFRFQLYDSLTDGNQIGNAVAEPDVVVEDGLFTVVVDFGAGAFDGGTRYLELAVRESGSVDDYQVLEPRQALTAVPYAQYAAEAGGMAWSGLSGVPAGLDDGDDDTTYKAGTGLILSGNQFDAQGSPYANVIVVAKSGGDFKSIQTALDSIDDASTDNPYLVYVAPGVYTEQVTLKSHVTVEGAGEEATIIRWTGSEQSPLLGDESPTVIGANDATLRHLTVESDGRDSAGIYFSVAIYNFKSAPTLSHVTATAVGGSWTIPVVNNISSPIMRYVTLLASDGRDIHLGIYNLDRSSPTMDDVTVMVNSETGNIGVYNEEMSSPTMNNITVTSSSNEDSTGVHNVNSSPTMSNLSVTTSGGLHTYGVYNASNSSPGMNNVTITASGGSFNYGVYNSNSSTTMTNAAVTASDGTSTYGIYNSNTSSILNYINVTASGGVSNYGVYNTNSSATISHSMLTGSTHSVRRDDDSNVQVANSQLVGPLSAGLTCFNNYDENLAAINCQ